MLKVITLAAMATALAVSGSQPAAARNGGAVAAGAITGLAAGAIIGSAASRNYYGGPGYVEPSYQPVYGPCHTERERVVDEYGRSHWRRIRVCD